MPGDSTPWLEVTNISQNGIWLLVDNEEFFMSYEEYPQFLRAQISEVFHVKRRGKEAIYWPDLSVRVLLSDLRQSMQKPQPEHI